MFVFCFQFRHADRRVETGTEWTTRHAPARRLNRTHDLGLAKQSVHSARRFLAFADSVDHFAAAVRAIAAGENMRQARPAGLEVAHHRAVAIQL